MKAEDFLLWAGRRRAVGAGWDAPSAPRPDSAEVESIQPPAIATPCLAARAANGRIELPGR